MATKKLQSSRDERAEQVVVLPALPDGRNVTIHKGTFHLTTMDSCTCGDYRFKKQNCKHLLAVYYRTNH
jgi:hypothetical protein